MIPVAILHSVVVERRMVSTVAEVLVLSADAVGHVVGLADVEAPFVIQALNHVHVYTPLSFRNVTRLGADAVFFMRCQITATYSRCLSPKFEKKILVIWTHFSIFGFAFGAENMSKISVRMLVKSKSLIEIRSRPWRRGVGRSS